MFRRISLLLEKYGLFALAVAVVLLALPAYLRTAQTAPAPVGDAHQESAVALRILFGVQRIGPKTWDGEMTVDRGAILRLSGVYFEHADAIIGPNRWKCTSRATTYADSRSPRGYDPVHTHPWELIPNGIVATVEAPAGARVQVSTVSGNFSFTLDQLSLGQPLAFLEGDVTVERLPPTVTLTLQPGRTITRPWPWMRAGICGPRGFLTQIVPIPSGWLTVGPPAGSPPSASAAITSPTTSAPRSPRMAKTGYGWCGRARGAASGASMADICPAGGGPIRSS